MIDEAHYNLKSADSHELAIQMLGQLLLDAPGDKVNDILNVVVFAASLHISINQACQDLERPRNQIEQKVKRPCC